MLYHNPTLNFYHHHHHQAKYAGQDIDAPSASSPSSYCHTAEKTRCGYDGCNHDGERGYGHDCECECEGELEYSEYDTDSTLDKIQWQAWFDEVRSLIIYAGLLSAIVTPFIIESNKKLKPNQDELIASLLSRIVSSSSPSSPHYTDASFDSDTHIPPRTISTPDPFTPNPAHVRANTFWLISLILSVAVILMGSFVIQWLRVCRSYYSLPSFSVASGPGPTGNQSPLSPLFKLNFESKFDPPPTTPITPPPPTIRRGRAGHGHGPEKWHLRMALATLPLFLQLAVVLFLGGLMDFVQVFGDCAVLVSISVMVVFAMYIWRVGGMQ